MTTATSRLAALVAPLLLLAIGCAAEPADDLAREDEDGEAASADVEETGVTSDELKVCVKRCFKLKRTCTKVDGEWSCVVARDPASKYCCRYL